MMKNRYLAILLWTLVSLAGAAPGLSAQDYPPVPVSISRSQVNMNGKTYYVHIVLERQTIYGITKAYGVTEEDLNAANPLLAREGLKAGMVLYVPVVSEPKKAQEHEAAKGKPAEQEKPAVQQKTAVADTPSAQTPNEDGFIEHTVKWFEDIYDVAKAYGVTAEQIMAANGMKSSRISKRQKLLIPVTDKAKESLESKMAAVSRQNAQPAVQPVVQPEVVQDVPVEAETPVVISQPEPVVTDPEEGKTEEIQAAETDPDDADNGIFDWLTGKESVELGLLLPFNAAGRASETNMDFYSGVLLALRDLESTGLKATLNVYDLQDGVPSAPELEKNDFILGPITATDLSSVLDRTDGRTQVVSPLDQKAGDLAEARPGLVQAPSTVASQYTELAAWAADDRQPDDQIILVTEKVAGGTAAATGVREALLAAGTPFEGVSWTLAEGRSLPASLTARLTRTGVNRIIVASEKESFVADVVRNLVILLSRNYKIAMYAPSKVRTFETIDGSTYHQSDLHICSQYFADYDTPEVKSFVRSYRALYRTEPSQFAFQGYDLTHYFVQLVSKYGNRWTRALTRVPETGLHTDFRFEKTPAGSYRNTGIRRIVYDPDYSTYLVR